MENFENIRLPWTDWKIVKYLGGGAYGKVYEIERNISGMQERAALKIVSRPKDESEIESYYNEGYSKAELIASYESEIRNYVQEYKLMKELQGESNIVSCDDFTMIPHDDGIGGDIFIRMELLTSLQQKMRERNLSEQEIIRLGKDISHALVLCESKNIIHRDIKPANIMVSQFGNYKLGDFGVSKLWDQENYVATARMPNFEAPEIIHMEKYGYTADIYSLGILLYWLLNNRRMPFIGADEQLTPRRIVEATTRRYNGERIPTPKNGSEELKQIVLKACAYRPEDRYASAQEMYDALDKIGIGYSTISSSNPVYGHPTVSFFEDCDTVDVAEWLLSKIEVEKLTAKNVIRTIICGIVVLGIAIAMVIVGASARIDFIAVIGSLMPYGGVLYWFLFRMGAADFSEWMKANKENIKDFDKYIQTNSEFARRLYYKKCRKKYLLEYMNRMNPDVVKSIKDSQRIRIKDFKRIRIKNEKKEIPTVELKFVDEPSEEQIQEMVRKRNEILKQMGYTFDENGKFYKPQKKSNLNTEMGECTYGKF